MIYEARYGTMQLRSILITFIDFFQSPLGFYLVVFHDIVFLVFWFLSRLSPKVPRLFCRLFFLDFSLDYFLLSKLRAKTQ